MRKVNLGCGYRKFSEYINVDYNPYCMPDILHDLNKGLPFDSDSIDEIVAYDFIEHCRDFVSTMNEIGRVLKVGGTAKFVFPLWTQEGAFSIAHSRVVVYQDFHCFVPKKLKNFTVSLNGEKVNKCFKVLMEKTIQGKCEYCPKRGFHTNPKCHVILEKIQ